MLSSKRKKEAFATRSKARTLDQHALHNQNITAATLMHKATAGSSDGVLDLVCLGDMLDGLQASVTGVHGKSCIRQNA